MRTAFIVSALAFIVPTLGAPTAIPITKRAGPIEPGSFIKLKDGASNDGLWSQLIEELGLSGSSITHDYRPLMSAFSADLKDAGLTLLQRMSEVEFIQQDTIVGMVEHDDDDAARVWECSLARMTQ
ncbi:hypothetical protein FRC11_001852 [Ceratobasidium sp. 423]|nr:hypothetical protein FRC11_001852 [Ceratobasidium sp. 423]